MEEDNEVLDWGNEEDEQHQEPLRTPFTEDADDIVSLGDEDDDDTFYAQQPDDGVPPVKTTEEIEYDSANYVCSNVVQDMLVVTSSQAQQVSRRDEPQAGLTTQVNVSTQNESPTRSQPLLQPRLTHALPPKPIAASMPYLPPSHPSIVEATAMASRTRDFKRATGSTEKTPHKDPLPPNWEIRYPRSGGRTYYYYNIATHESTWHHPGLSPPPNRTKSGSNSSKPPSVDSYLAPLSYEDRHYRPGDAPELRREDPLDDEVDAERVHTPSPRSRSLDQPRSALPPLPTPRQLPTGIKDRSHSSHSDRDADLKGDISHQSRDHDLPAADASALHRTSSKAQNGSSEHTNHETRHQRIVPASVADSTSLANEERPLLSRSYSTQGHNRERENRYDTVEGRQEVNHSLSLASSRPRSPALREHGRVPPQREHREPAPAQKASVAAGKVEPAPQAMPPSRSRRDRPSRFDQPPVTATGQSSTGEQITPHPREGDAYIVTAFSGGLPDLHARHNDLTRLSQQVPIQDSEIPYTPDSRSTSADNGLDKKQEPPPDSGRVSPASDQPVSSRRKRAPLPPQAATFREETSRRRDHDVSKVATTRPASVPFSGLPERQHSNINNSDASSRGSHPAVIPYTQAESDVERRHGLSVSGSQYANNGERKRTSSVERGRSGPASSYSLARARSPSDVPMDIDGDRLPSSSSRVTSGPPSRGRDNASDGVSRQNAPPSSDRSVSGNNSSAETPVLHLRSEMKKEGVREDLIEQPLTRQDYPPQNQRAIHERPERHVPRRRSRGRSNEYRQGFSGPVPKLTGPNSVPIGSRRQIDPTSDSNSCLPDDASPSRHLPESPVWIPKHFPSLPGGRDSQEKPTHDVRGTVDNFQPSLQDYTIPGQHHQKTSPQPYIHNHQTETANSVAQEGHQAIYSRQHSRFDQPVRENRAPRPYDDRPAPGAQSQTRSPSTEWMSVRDRILDHKLPPKPIVAHISTQSHHSDFPPAKGMPHRRSGGQYRPGKQGQQNPQPEDYRPPKLSPVPLSAGEIPHSLAPDDRQYRLNKQDSQQRDYRLPRPASPQLASARASLDEDDTWQQVQQYGATGRGLSNIKPPKTMLDSDNFNQPPQRRSDVLRDQIASPVDDDFEYSRRADSHSNYLDDPYGDWAAEQSALSNRGAPGNRDSYPPARRQRQSERTRPDTPATSERRTKWGETHPAPAPPASGVPEPPDDRATWRGPVDRYEPDRGDGESHRSRRPSQRSSNDDHRGDPSYRGHGSYTLQHHDYEMNRSGTRRLLDRLSLDTPHSSSYEGLRDRVRIPEKRDRNEADHDYPMDIPRGASGAEAGEPPAKRSRRRGNRLRRGRRGSGPA